MPTVYRCVKCWAEYYTSVDSEDDKRPKICQKCGSEIKEIKGGIL